MWKINGTQIQSPDSKGGIPGTQSATNRVISGDYFRDYIGDEKLTFHCEWAHMAAASFAVLKAFYDSQRTTGATMTLTVDELAVNFPVIIDFGDYDFPVANNYEYAGLKVNFIQI